MATFSMNAASAAAGVSNDEKKCGLADRGSQLPTMLRSAVYRERQARENAVLMYDRYLLA